MTNDRSDSSGPIYHQANRAFQSEPRHDPSPQKFRDAHPEDQFADASGVLFEQAMGQTRMAICLCDPNLPDLPIVFANRAFRELTGYDEEDIIGNNCRFLQGPETDPKSVERLRSAIESEDVTVVELLNYRKNGDKFWNALHIGPIYSDAGELLYFFGSQWDVSDVRAARAEELYAREMARELSHRMKNMFAVISGIVNLTARLRGAEGVAKEINERVQALGRAYETTLDEARSGNIEIGQAIRAILKPYEESGWNVEYKGNGLRVPFAVVSGLGLALHELAANATKHGAWANDDGTVSVDWQESDAGAERMMRVEWVERGGPGLTGPATQHGAGHAIIDRMVGYGGGRVHRDWQPAGLRVELEFPIGEAEAE